MKRFDELELVPEASWRAPVEQNGPSPAPPPEALSAARRAPRLKRMMAALTDLSLFVALAIVLGTMIPRHPTWSATLEAEWPGVVAASGFLLLVSFFYFAGCWLIWGRTIGGAIFDVRTESEAGSRLDIRQATSRWLWTLLSLAAGGIGFLPALFPSARSLPDRASGSCCVVA
jgi:uncharacterized RDD family membrane protein YckC